jgi:hypothetical protein
MIQNLSLRSLRPDRDMQRSGMKHKPLRQASPTQDLGIARAYGTLRERYTPFRSQ